MCFEARGRKAHVDLITMSEGFGGDNAMVVIQNYIANGKGETHV